MDGSGDGLFEGYLTVEGSGDGLFEGYLIVDGSVERVLMGVGRCSGIVLGALGEGIG